MKKVPVRNSTGIPPTTWGWSLGTRNAWLVSKILEKMSGNPLLLLGEYGTFSLWNKERGEWSDSEKTMWKHYNLRKLLFYAICVLSYQVYCYPKYFQRHGCKEACVLIQTLGKLMSIKSMADSFVILHARDPEINCSFSVDTETAVVHMTHDGINIAFNTMCSAKIVPKGDE